MSVSVVTYPGVSYTNPAERAMSLLHIAMQGVALSRVEMVPEYESMLKTANSMEQIRAVCDGDEELTI